MIALNFLAILSFVLVVVFSTLGIYKFIRLVEELKKRSDSHCDLIIRNISITGDLQVRVKELEEKLREKLEKSDERN